MFKSKPRYSLGKSVENFETIIGATIRIDGNIVVRNSIRIDGLVNGSIFQEDGAEATVAVAQGATVNGDIRAKQVIVSGNLQGNIFSSDRVELLETAFVTGDITYGTLGMLVGAKLYGKIRQADSDPIAQSVDTVINLAMQKK